MEAVDACSRVKVVLASLDDLTKVFSCYLLT